MPEVDKLTGEALQQALKSCPPELRLAWTAGWHICAAKDCPARIRKGRYCGFHAIQAAKGE